jgi:hypothetical protein
MGDDAQGAQAVSEIRVLRRQAPPPRQDIIDKLREMLAQAETGEMRELLVYYVDGDQVHWDAYVDDLAVCAGTI